MGDKYRKGSHTVFDIQYHFVWVTKYRYQILKGDIALRTRELLRQTCEARGLTILSGHVSKDHIHLHLSCPPELSPSKIAQYLKGRSSRLLQQEFPALHKRYWGQHIWARGYFCASIGAVTEKMIAAYIAQQEEASSENVIKVSDE
jgi:putative transposase